MNLVLRNEDVKMVRAFIPEGHKHVRILISTVEGDIVIQEATAAAIVRAYIYVKTHPRAKEITLCREKVEDGKEGYAKYQLTEEGCSLMEEG